MTGVPSGFGTVTIAAVLFVTSLNVGMSSSTSTLTALGVGTEHGWTNVSSEPSPPPMAGAMMAYSWKAHRFVLFGGWDGIVGLNGTWTYDPGNRTWDSLNPNVRPMGRGDGMFAYHGRTDSFILFGGWHEEANETYTRLGDTWVFSLATETWVERHPAVSPSPRSDSEVVYDPVADAVLLVGGFNGTAYLGDVWSYDLSTDTWSPRPSSGGPSPRADGRLVYIEGQDRSILFGGNDYSGPNYTYHHLSDTWSYHWGTNQWTRMTPREEPTARDYPLFAFDPTAKVALLTGGFGNGPILDDIWGFDPMTNEWANLTPKSSPPPRFAAVGGFDLEHGALVVFSGLSTIGLLSDTWTYGVVSSSESPQSPSSIALAGLSALILSGIIAAIFFVTRRGHRSGGRD